MPRFPLLVCTSVLLGFTVLSGPALASSHREAPFITRNPKVDATDFYLFNSYEAGREGYVTVLANYLPLQDPYGGPNYFTLDPDGHYEIHFDNNGDAREDLTFSFDFALLSKNIALDIGTGAQKKSVTVPFSTVGPVSATNTAAQNISEEYSVQVLRGPRRSSVGRTVTNARDGARVFAKPLDNIGAKSIPNYAAYARSFVYEIAVPGCDRPGRMFVGQRKDPFVVNLGETFDLVNIKNPLGAPDAARDDLADKNVTTLALELWGKCLTGSGSTIGAWTTASLPQNRRLSLTPTLGRPSNNSITWVQVSRLSNPLVNEVVIGLNDKDRFNASEPRDDGQFADYVTHPTLPAVLELLYGSAGVKAPTTFPRTDLVAAFLTGVEGLNKNGSVAEMLRLNTSIAAKPAAMQNPLGVIAGDTAGFPNGRRLGDDVVDIALRVVMGKLLPLEQAPSGQLPFTDGARIDASMFDSAFPYVRTPIAGSPQR